MDPPHREICIHVLRTPYIRYVPNVGRRSRAHQTSGREAARALPLSTVHCPSPITTRPLQSIHSPWPSPAEYPRYRCVGRPPSEAATLTIFPSVLPEPRSPLTAHSRTSRHSPHHHQAVQPVFYSWITSSGIPFQRLSCHHSPREHTSVGSCFEYHQEKETRKATQAGMEALYPSSFMDPFHPIPSFPYRH